MPGIYAIELTNCCNAKCSFCPHDKMTRERGFISLSGVDICIKHMQSRNQKYVALHHMGEPLLHPKLFDVLQMFNKADINVEFSTNGELLDKLVNLPVMGQPGCEVQLPVLSDLIDTIRISVDYFYDKPGYIQTVIDFLDWCAVFSPELNIRIHTITGKDLSVFKKSVDDIASVRDSQLKIVYEQKTYDNWAGQVDGDSQLNKSNSCYFIDYNYVVIAWDGKILKCCMDYNGEHVKGNIYQGDLDYMVPNRRCKCICEACANMQFAEGGKWDKVRRD